LFWRLQDAENDAESKKPAYNVQQLEECDLMPDDASAVLVFDGDTHNIVHQVNIDNIPYYVIIIFIT